MEKEAHGKDGAEYNWYKLKECPDKRKTLQNLE
jgi:hypothetical protein